MSELSFDQSLCVTIRADAGPSLGYGHVRRTLSVANKLQVMAGMQVRYLMKPESDSALVQASGCDVIHLTDSSIESLVAAVKATDGPLILDTYALTKGDLECLEQAGFCTVVFDDGKRLESYPANVVIDYAPGATQLPYQGLTTTCFCLGPAYFPLRRKFLDLQVHRNRRRPIQRVVITFGGSDPDDQTARTVKLFSQHSHPWKVVAILGPGYTGRAEEVALPEGFVELRRNVADMAQVLAAADFVISGAGGTALELAYLGVPGLLLVLSEDQQRIASALAQVGAAINLGWSEHVSDHDIWHAIEQVAADSTCLDEMSAAGQRLVDGQGAKRIARAIIDVWSRHQAIFTDRAEQGQNWSRHGI